MNMDTIAYDLVKDFTCNPCKFITTQRDIFEEHMNTVHSHMQPNFCKEFKGSYLIIYVAKTTFWNEVTLRKPVKVTFKKLKEFTCEACNYKTVIKLEFKQHKKNFHNHKYTCQQCGLKMAHSLKRHVDTVHNNIRSFSCGHCDYEAKSRFNLNRHVKNTHDQIKDFACGQCNFRTGDHPKLKRHVDDVHNDIRRFPCEHCDHKAKSRSNLDKHVKNIHENMEYFCGQCNFRTKEQPKLQDHFKEIHSMIKNIVCHQCKFRTPHQHVWHIERHNEQIQNRNTAYECNFCKFATTTQELLNDHHLNMECFEM